MVLSMNDFNTDAKVELSNSKFSFRSNASFTYNYLFTKQHKEVFSTGILSTFLKVSTQWKIKTGREDGFAKLSVQFQFTLKVKTFFFEQISDIGHI